MRAAIARKVFKVDRLQILGYLPVFMCLLLITANLVSKLNRCMECTIHNDHRQARNHSRCGMEELSYMRNVLRVRTGVRS